MGGSSVASLTRWLPAALLAGLFLVPTVPFAPGGSAELPAHATATGLLPSNLNPLAAAQRSLAAGLGPTAAGASTPSWNETHPVTSGDPAMAYDAADGEVVLFQGLSAPQYNATWVYHGGNWTRLPVTVGPSSRSGESMAYDPADGEVVLFGGEYSTTFPVRCVNDTWTFRGGTWTHVATPANGTPMARADAAMTYDAARKAVVLFGGTDVVVNWTGATGRVLQDTWSFSAGRWRQLPTSLEPSPRFDASFGYDPATGGDVLFGGDFVQYYPNSTAVRGDTWTFRGGNWSPAIPVRSPAARVGAGFAYDAPDRVMVLFGGTTAAVQYYAGYRSQTDTWEYANGTWVPLAVSGPPASDSLSPLVAGLANGTILLFGVPAWTFRLGAWTLTDPAPRPPSVGEPLLAYDANDGYVLMLGGGSYYPRINVTWTFQDGRWTDRSGVQAVNPPYDSSDTMTYDPIDGYVVLWGGLTNQTWTFEGGYWTNLNLTVEPTYRWGSQLVFDPEAGYAVLFGGSECFPGYWYVYCHWHNDTWGFVHGAWFPVAPKGGVAPPGRSGEAMVFDGADGYLLMFGGLVCPNATSCVNANDTWKFAAGAWSPVLTPVAPGPRFGAGMTYDAANGSVLLYGGSIVDPQGPYNASEDGTWLYSAGAWSLLTFPGEFVPPPDMDPGLSYVPDLGKDLFLDASSESWTLQLPPRADVPLHAWASGRVTAGDVPLLVSLGGATSGGHGPYSYTWNFGDGSFGTGASPSHRYDAAGTFIATVTAVDGHGDRASSNLTIQVDPVPQVAATVSPINGTVPLRITVSANVQGGGTPYSAHWSFGDGTNASGLVATHTYRVAGTFVVSVQVVDRFGVRAFGVPWTVTSDSLLAGLSLTASPVPVVLGGPLTLTASVDGASGAFSYSWGRLPPGCSGADASGLVCSPSGVGTYYPVVTVTDAAGETASAETTVVVLPPPIQLTVNASPAVVPLGAPVRIVAEFSGGIGPLVLQWRELPPGCPDLGNAIGCTPTSLGVFPVQALVHDAANQTVVASATVAVTPVSPSGTTAPRTGGGLSPAEYVLLGAAVGVLATVAVALLLRSGKRP